MMLPRCVGLLMAVFSALKGHFISPVTSLPLRPSGTPSSAFSEFLPEGFPSQGLLQSDGDSLKLQGGRSHFSEASQKVPHRFLLSTHCLSKILPLSFFPHSSRVFRVTPSSAQGDPEVLGTEPGSPMYRMCA